MYPIAGHSIPPPLFSSTLFLYRWPALLLFRPFSLSHTPNILTLQFYIQTSTIITRAPFLLSCFPFFSLCVFFVFASTHFAISAPLGVCVCLCVCVFVSVRPLSFFLSWRREEEKGWPVFRAYRCALCSRLLSSLRSPFVFAVRRFSYLSPRFLTRPMSSRSIAGWWRSLPPSPPKNK